MEIDLCQVIFFFAFLTVQSVTVYTEPIGINLSLGGSAGADMHRGVQGERIAFQSSFAERQDILSCQLKGTVPFLTPHPPIAPAASYISCAERHRKMGI